MSTFTKSAISSEAPGAAGSAASHQTTSESDEVENDARRDQRPDLSGTDHLSSAGGVHGWASRRLIGLVPVAVTLAMVATYPRWASLEFSVAYAAFLACAGLTRRVLRMLHLRIRSPLGGMFLVAFPVPLAFRPWILIEIHCGAIARPGPFHVPEPTKWGAFWWIAVRTRQMHA
jgi:hypothetical protein